MTRRLIMAALVTCAVASTARGQQSPDWELRPFAGIAIPTGAHRGVFSNALSSGVEAALRLTPGFDLVGAFAWQPSRGKYTVGERYADVWVYNFGLERRFRDERLTGGGFVPFVGGGVGGRAYDFRSSSLNSSTCYSGYLSGGTAYERDWSTIRFEARDNVFCYRSPIGALDQQTHNEIGVLVGFGIRF